MMSRPSVPRPPRPAALNPVLAAALLLPALWLGASAPAAAQSPATAAGAPASPAEPRFDLAVSNAPAAQVFLQLAQGSGYNMLVAPEVSGSLSITLKDTTVPEALETLRELFGYDFRIAGKRVFIYPNTVQTRLYRINYLPGRRQGSSDLRVTSGSISTAGAGGATAQAANGAAGGNTGGDGAGGSADNAKVRTTSDADFWREVQAALTTMVGEKEGRNVVMNPAAGVIVIKASPTELRQVEAYLRAVQLSIERQVMLEAKIIEVQLSKEQQTGINWSGFGKILGDKVSTTIGVAAPGSVLGTSGNLSTSDATSIASGVSLAAGAVGKGFYGLAFQASNFAGLLNFLETQGDVQVLSSPRIATLNNQKAVLKVGSDELYVTGVSSSQTSTSTSTSTMPTVVLQPFFSGISLDVTPQIDDEGNVILHVHPTISTVTEKSKNLNLGSLGSYTLPLATSAVNETDSIVRVRDGQIVAIGGLMKASSSDDRSGVSGLQNTPILGALFRQTATVQTKRELVILLKPTVIREEQRWPDMQVPQTPRTDAIVQARSVRELDAPATAPAVPHEITSPGRAVPGLPAAGRSALPSSLGR
ncbi:MAG: hypothetical protein RLY78_4186 [Pseudomonadota bacterium]|jgi:MSHA biogenesis protein MshL